MTDILTMVILGTCAAVLVPESRGDGYRKLIRMMAGLALLLLMADTVSGTAEHLRSFISQLEETVQREWTQGEEIREEAEDWVIRRGIRNVEEGAAALVRSRFALTGEITVQAECASEGDGTVSIRSLRIFLPSSCGTDPQEVEQYLESLLSCPCRAECQ